MDLRVDRWLHDTISGSVSSKRRKLGELIGKLDSGDVLIVTEVSRLSRTLIDIMNIIQHCVARNITLHCIKEGYIFEDNLNSKILGFAFGLVAEIERNLISARTKEALAVKRAKGVRLGRPEGSSPKMAVLVRNIEPIREMLREGAAYRTVARQYDVSLCTFNRFIKKYMTGRTQKVSARTGGKEEKDVSGRGL